MAVFAGSCTYDPNYWGASAYGGSGYGGGESSGSYGYGYGYGHGGSSFSTSFFISTGDSRWGYDPYCNAYYDYRRRCYYDPYLYGYYPYGYRPPVIVGVPHPHGYRRNYCPPPSRVTSITLVNYSQRERAYRSSNYSWAREVRQQEVRPSRGDGGRPGGMTRPSGGGSGGFFGGASRPAPEVRPAPSTGGSIFSRPGAGGVRPQGGLDRPSGGRPTSGASGLTRPSPPQTYQEAPVTTRPALRPSVQPDRSSMLRESGRLNERRARFEVPRGGAGPSAPLQANPVPQPRGGGESVPAPSAPPVREVRGLGEVPDGGRGRGR